MTSVQEMSVIQVTGQWYAYRYQAPCLPEPTRDNAITLFCSFCSMRSVLISWTPAEVVKAIVAAHALSHATDFCAPRVVVEVEAVIRRASSR